MPTFSISQPRRSGCTGGPGCSSGLGAAPDHWLDGGGGFELVMLQQARANMNGIVVLEEHFLTRLPRTAARLTPILESLSATSAGRYGVVRRRCVRVADCAGG